MVLSKIDSSISYPELKRANPEDKSMETDLYELNVRDTDIVIAIGNSRDDFKKKGVIYYPIYLVTNTQRVVQIGVYEIPKKTMDKYLDADGNLDLEKTAEPLVYKFASRAFLEKKRMVPDEDSDDEYDETAKKVSPEATGEDSMQPKKTSAAKIQDDAGDNGDQDVASDNVDVDIPETRRDIFILTKGVSIPARLPEESKQEAKNIRDKYKDVPQHGWLQKIMKNPHYDSIENEGDGDCLFATIRDAFSQIAQQTSVAKIRKKLADEANEEVFMNYKEMYDMYNTAIITDTNKIKEMAKHYVELKDKFAHVLDRTEQKMLVENAKKVKDQHDNLVREKKVTAQMLGEFKFMKGIDTLEKFKKKIQTCEFWGETWAISTLERILNIKFVLLSEEAYVSKDYDNILHCGQLNDGILQNKGRFAPDYYIVVEFTGQHYRLVSYKDKQIFTFAEIPYDLKKLIVDKCMERNAGVFSLIKEFADLKKKLDAKSGDKGSVESLFDIEDLSESKLRGVYDDDIVFSFYSKSAAKPLPGKGSGEKIPSDHVKEFTPLANIPDWRKKLANTWPQPFTVDNHKWTSVEHYYQASKFKKDNPEFYLSFSLDSGTDLSKDVDMAIAAGGKTGKYKKELLRPKQVQIDPDFFGERSKEETAIAQRAKFTQNEDLLRMLLATKNAKLVEHKRGREPEAYETLMLLRDELIKENATV